MAQEIVGVKIQVDGSQATEQVGSLKKQLKEATQDVQRLSDQFGATSKEAIEAAKRAADLRDRIGDAKALTDAFNPEAKFKALGQSLSAVTGGFAAVQGAIGLFGEESKDLEKQLLKVQSAIALTQGIEQLAGLSDAFTNLKAVAINAFNGIKAAIGSTGIGLLVVALGAIVAYWDDIKAAVSGVSEEQERLNKQTKDNLEAQKKKTEALDLQENSLRLQGKSEREILVLKQAQVKQELLAAEAQIKSLKSTKTAQVQIAQRNKDILQGFIRIVTAPITGLLKGLDLVAEKLGSTIKLEEKFSAGIAELFFDPAKVASEADAAIGEAEKGLQELQSKYDGYQVAINNIDKQAADKRRQNADKARQEQTKENEKELERRKEDTDFEEKQILKRAKNYGTLGAIRVSVDEKVANRQTEFQKQQEALVGRNIEINTDAAYKDLANSQAVLDKKKKDTEEQIKLEEAKKEAQIGLAQSALQTVSQLVDQNSIAGKAIAIAQAIINTYQGASKALAQGGVFGPVAAAATIAAGLVQVKKIVSTKIPSATGTGSVQGGGGGSIALASAPIGPQVPQAQLTQLNQQSINQLGSATSRAYVVESDVTSSQERQARINRAARIG